LLRHSPQKPSAPHTGSPVQSLFSTHSVQKPSERHIGVSPPQSALSEQVAP
jgi:hypothetical protein